MSGYAAFTLVRSKVKDVSHRAIAFYIVTCIGFFLCMVDLFIDIQYMFRTGLEFMGVGFLGIIELFWKPLR